MSSPDLEYARQLNKARRALFNGNGFPEYSSQNLVELLADLIVQIGDDFGAGIITAERARTITRQANARLQELGVILERQIIRDRDTAVRFAFKGHQDGIEAINATTGANLTINLNGMDQRTVEYLSLRRGLKRYQYRTLISRNLQGIQEDVERFVDIAVARGLSAQQGAKALARSMTMNEPKIQALLQRKTKTMTLEEFRALEFGADDLKKLRMALFDARRIMVTEINTAYREADLLASLQSPVVEALKWEVSGRHYGLKTTPDVCTFYAEQDLFDMGSGVYPIENFPSTPHPFCGCGKTHVLRAPKDWSKPKQTLKPFSGIDLERNAAFFNGKSEKFIERQIATANSHLGLAESTARRYGSVARTG